MTLRRTGFGRAMLVRKPPTALIMARRVGLGLEVRQPRAAVMADCAAGAQPVPKEDAIRHEGYRRLVASLPCIHCGVAGLSQCAHANAGKGAGIKASDLESFPLCCDSPGRPGCHSRFDAGALFDKAARRLIEPAWAADTRRRIQAMGAWPKGLPQPEAAW